MLIKKIILLLMMNAGVLSVSAAALPSLPQSKSLSNHIQALFMQQAKTLRVTSYDQSSHCFILSLDQPRRHVIYFSDQPQRVTGKVSLKQFIADWQLVDQKRKFSPNISMHADMAHVSPKAKNSSVDVVFSASHPVYQQGAVQYNACVINKKDVLKVGKVYNNPILFIDQWQNWPP